MNKTGYFPLYDHQHYVFRAASNFYEKFYEIINTGFTEKTPLSKLYRMICLSILIKQIVLQNHK